MYETNTQKAKLEFDTERQKLKLEIANLNTQVAKWQTSWSEAASKADSVDDMKETVAVTEKKFEEKVKELFKAQQEIEKLKNQMKEKEKDLMATEARVAEMEDYMRSFTSIADTAEMDDTFEAVLRSEFQLMRARLTEKIETLATEKEHLSADLIRHKADSQAYIERLKVQMMAMSNRLMKKD